MYLLIFDVSFVEMFNWKLLVDIATAERHRGLSNSYIKHHLFLQSKHGRDVELQNAHIFFHSSSWRDASQHA